MDRRRSLASSPGSKTQLEMVEMWQTDPQAPLAARIACVWLPRFALRVASSRDPLRKGAERPSSSRSPDDTPTANPTPTANGDDETDADIEEPIVPAAPVTTVTTDEQETPATTA